MDRPMGYTVGILHDIGRIALLMLFPDEYAVFLDVSLTGDLDKLEAERNLYDADQVGDSLAMSWNFSPIVNDVIAHHHDEVTSETPRMRLLVQAACMAANMSGFHAAGPGQPWPTSPAGTPVAAGQWVAAAMRRADGKSGLETQPDRMQSAVRAYSRLRPHKFASRSCRFFQELHQTMKRLVDGSRHAQPRA
jgi:hypothetical protein